MENKKAGIDPKELRLNNLIKYDTGEIGRVVAIHGDEVAIDQDNELMPMNCYLPIELSPEILEKCGFEQQYKDHPQTYHLLRINPKYYLTSSNGGICLHKEKQGVIYSCERATLHFMQNLVQLLTSTDLKINM